MRLLVAGSDSPARHSASRPPSAVQPRFPSTFLQVHRVLLQLQRSTHCVSTDQHTFRQLQVKADITDTLRKISTSKVNSFSRNAGLLWHRAGYPEATVKPGPSADSGAAEILYHHVQGIAVLP